MYKYLNLILLLIGFVCCQNEIPEDVQKTLERGLSEIPGLANFNQSAVPQIEEVEEVIRKKCEKNGGSEAFEKLGPAKDAMQECIETNFNFTEMELEINESRRHGAMEVVFAKYCGKKELVLQCLDNLTQAIDPCLEENEKTSVKIFKNITENLAEFMCYKDGDRVAMFIAEGGFDCLQSKKEELEACANSTLAHRIPKDLSLTNLPLFVIDEEGCKDYFEIQSCVVNELEKCPDSTPANIVDALFKFVRRITPCRDYKPPKSLAKKYNSPDSSSVQVASFVLISLVGLLHFI